MNSTNMYRRVIAATAMAVALVGATSVASAARPVGQAGSSQNDPTMMLTSAFRAEWGTLTSTASSEDLEASLVYVLSQNRYTVDIAVDALDRLAASPNVAQEGRVAIANVRAMLLRRRLTRGTAAIGGGGMGFSSSFSAPVSSVGGGGSSNYVQ